MKNLLLISCCLTLLVSCRINEEKAVVAEVADTSYIINVINSGDVEFEEYFEDRTMRLDYFHSGTATEEHFATDRILSDGIWSGSKRVLIDELNLGAYYFEVIDRATGVLLYSRGFGSIFGEWQTIPEASEKWGTFHESVRFPWPRMPVTVMLNKRDTQNIFRPLWTTDIDPSERNVNKGEVAHTNKIDIILANGPADSKMDIVILGDGYSTTEMYKFKRDAIRLSGYLMDTEPFKSRKNDFNIRAIETPSHTSGVTRPHHGVFNRTPLSVHYSSFDSERYALTYDNRKVRDIASQVPYDLMVILMNEKTYGGGGIYNLYTTVAADNKFAEYIMVHEMGHHLAALADEYYTSSVSYEVPEITVEPWETNITALFDPADLKWRDLVEDSTPLPTPWNKEEFDRAGHAIQRERDSLRAARAPESIVEDLFIRQLAIEDGYFEKEEYRYEVGAFEGAGYLSRGLYRPQVDCIMYTRHMQFCQVCRKSIEAVIDQQAR